MHAIIAQLLHCFIVTSPNPSVSRQRGNPSSDGGVVNNRTIEQWSNRKPKLRAGFTLIELLVTIAIIGILATIVVAGVSNYLARARDAKRIADFEEIKNALITYYADNAEYPESTLDGIDCWSNWQSGSVINDPNDTFIQELVTEGYLDHVPIETSPFEAYSPITGVNDSSCSYRYGKKTCGIKTFAVLFADLETDAGQKDFRPPEFDGGGQPCDWYESDPNNPAQDKRDWAIFLVE